MPEQTWLDATEQRAFRALSRSTRALLLHFDRELQQSVGMPRTYFEILWFLAHEPDRTLRMSDLAEVTGSQPSRITHAVGRLESDGLVRRELSGTDRRVWYVVITAQGRLALEQARPVYARLIRRHFVEPLSASDLEQVSRIGERLLEALETDRETARAGESTAPAGAAATA